MKGGCTKRWLLQREPIFIEIKRLPLRLLEIRGSIEAIGLNVRRLAGVLRSGVWKNGPWVDVLLDARLNIGEIVGEIDGIEI
jgi:hypothetical protein